MASATMNSMDKYFEATAFDANKLTSLLRAKGLDIDDQAQRAIKMMLVSAYQDGMIAAFKEAAKSNG